MFSPPAAATIAPHLPLHAFHTNICQNQYSRVVNSKLPTGVTPRHPNHLRTLTPMPAKHVQDEEELIGSVKRMLCSVGDGDISVSAYDTAWVSLVEDGDGKGQLRRRRPQFPACLQWIAENQLSDGSWGDGIVFVAHDRILCTLACVIALRKWGFRPHQSQKGLDFIRDNLGMLEKEEEERITIGFEVAFPSLLRTALKMNVEVSIPNDLSLLQHIYAARLKKLSRIPNEVLHSIPTTLLHSLEGMEGMEWEKLLELKCADGSFLFSPSSTAYAVMETRHPSCLRYLQQTVQKFNGGVPNVYPVDLFERLWVVDRLQRLGICRHFKTEVENCVEYVSRYWTSRGICWARNTRVNDIDDTAMGFRLLRLHGYDVSADVFRNFERGGEFFCFEGQSNQSVTGMFNLYRAAQLRFKGEKILEEAMVFSKNFLSEKLANNKVVDKWVIAKDLKGEIEYALEVPWLGSLPRVETRLYLEQYGGEDDVWIGKTIYRMPLVNNNTFLELAKLDYNKCNQIHLQELKRIREWYMECRLEIKGVTRRCMEVGYFVAMASLFEPEKAAHRLAWSKTGVLLKMTTALFERSTLPEIAAFYDQFITFVAHLGATQQSVSHYCETRRTREMDIMDTLCHELANLSHFLKDMRHHLFEVWRLWLKSWVEFRDDGRGEAGLLVSVINLCRQSAQPLTAVESHSLYRRMTILTNRICTHLYKHEGHDARITYPELDSDVKELIEMVLTSSSDVDVEVRRTYLTVVRAYYYTACLPTRVVDRHMSLVLFQTI